MKRDMDLVRLILLKIEEQDVNDPSVDAIEIEGFSTRIVLEHVRLLESAGMISDTFYDVAGNASAQRITRSGYDYLDTVRDNTI